VSSAALLSPGNAASRWVIGSGMIPPIDAPLLPLPLRE
jgi:hypothetical protein